MRKLWLILIGIASALGTVVSPGFGQDQSIRKADIIVYGGTSGAITAAIQAKKLGHSVIVVSPDQHLGGLTSGGLGFTDTGNKAVIGGLAREFYHRLWLHYQKPEAWKHQPRDTFGNRGQGNAAIDGELRTMWVFEPHVAEKTFEAMAKEHGLDIVRNAFLDRSENGVAKQGTSIHSIKTLDGTTYQGKMFIDATYEGDLLDAAGATFTVGREPNSRYGEKWNGVQVGVLHHGHHFGVLKQGISPYKVPGDPSSGLLPKISSDPPGEFGSGDHRVQAYCFRMCLTNHAPNRIPFPKPDGYNRDDYELLGRILNAGWDEVFQKFDAIPNHKTDTNNHGPFSTDNIGMNYDYPTATYERRQEIIAEHRQYQLGLMYYLANDPDVPDDVRTTFSTWGLAKDEFVQNNNWPHQLYIREARRLVGEMVMTEHEIFKNHPVVDPIGMGSYTMDSHNVQRYVTPEGFVQNEGDIGVSTGGPYPISMRALLPKREDVNNLLVPVCLSSSHIAYGSIRMEPVFMILGQSATTIASIAIKRQIDVQEVRYDEIKPQLVKDGQVLEYAASSPERIPVGSLKGIVIDNNQAKLAGRWVSSRSNPPFVGADYLHDDNSKMEVSTAEYLAPSTLQGKQQVRLSVSPGGNRSKRVQVHVRHAEGQSLIEIDQTKATKDSPWIDLGQFEFRDGGSVLLSNAGTEGYVVIDSVQWLTID